MMTSDKKLHQATAFSVIVVLLLSAFPFAVNAGTDIKDRVVIHVGAPSVWSLGQAHYLLAKMHEENLKLDTNMPKSDDLDPNAINITKLQIIKELLSIEAQFDEKIGVENRAELAEYKRKLLQRDRAEVELQDKKDELDRLDIDLRQLKKEQARMAKELEFRQAEREANPIKDPDDSTKTTIPLPDDDEKKLIKQKAALDSQITSKEAERADLVKEIDDLKKTADGTPAKPTLNNVQLEAGRGTLPGFTYLQDFLKKTIDQVDRPKLAATTVLDNFIGMQYEIIAKQLTLLRDEVGPDNRIVFLELPASIYTAASKGDNYIAQVQWQVKKFERLSPSNANRETNENGDVPDGTTRIYRTPSIENKIQQMGLQRTSNQPQNNQPQNTGQPGGNVTQPQQIQADSTDYQYETVPATSDLIRALDIIPRQSALNVNEVQATSKQFNFLGVLKLLVGFGLKVDYQRQKELYEQFLQQEVFAAGFGKGLNTFGWTFGPLPGSKRIAPGTRTMYAILVVPRYTTELTLQATGIAFKRKEAPEIDPNTLAYTNTSQIVFTSPEIRVSIPNEVRDQFSAEQVYYSSVPQGGAVTVVVKGRYFSPNMTVLVDDMALKRVRSIGNTATSLATADEAPGNKVSGQFELVSTNELIMKFSMGNKDYVGTPIITLVSPEKSSSINYFRMRINGDRGSLRALSLISPMFTEKFSLNKDIQGNDYLPATRVFPNALANYRVAYLRGTGLRNGATAWVDGRSINFQRYSNFFMDISREFITQIDARRYLVYFLPTNADKWSGRFRQRTNIGFEEADFSYNAPSTPTCTVRSYSIDAKHNEVFLDLSIAASNPRNLLMPFWKIVPGQSHMEDASHYRAVFSTTFTRFQSLQPESNQLVLSYNEANTVKQCSVKYNTRPLILQASITIPEAVEEQGALVNIAGLNLQNVVKVFVADQEASIIGEAGNDFVVVKVTKGAFIREHAGIKIPVVLITKDGTKVSGVVTVGKRGATTNSQ